MWRAPNGNDVLAGGAGGDLLDGVLGADQMTGRTGDDTYIVDNSGDTVNELPDGGFDHVKSSVSYTLPADVENLTLAGSAVNGTGNTAANRIVGNASNNRIDGGAGADEMLGGAGDDVYIVDDGNDRIVEKAGEGNDRVESSVSYSLSPDIEQLTLTGTESVNATGNVANNILIGNATNNTLDGGAGMDNMTGGAGNDTYVVDSTGDSVVELLNEGIDTVFSGVSITLLANNVENLVLTGTGALSGTGNTLDNVLIGNSANNTLNGGSGNDRLDGGAGADNMTGGTGDDTYVVDSAGDVVTENASEGNDTVETSLGYSIGLRPDLENIVLTGTASVNITGNASANRLTGNSGNNQLSGGAGNDILDGGAGTDTMYGNQGDDTYVVDNAGDVVTENANEGMDTIQSFVTRTLGANIENLTLIGLAATNATGNAANNVLIGNAANNTLDGGAGADTLTGAPGDDIYVVDDLGDTVTENLNDGTDTVQSSITYTLTANVENLTLTGSTAIDGTGNELANSITGNSAANILDGGGAGGWEGAGGNDTLVGGAGNDTYIAGNYLGNAEQGWNWGLVTADVIIENDATPGNLDTLRLGGLPDALQPLERHGNDLVVRQFRYGDDPWYDTFHEDVRIQNYFLGPQYQIERLEFADGSSYDLAPLLSADTTPSGLFIPPGYFYYGTDAAETLTTGAGHQKIYAGVGNDVLDGGAGDDLLWGDAGADTLIGGLGNDSLFGGAGDDTLSGGAGNDSLEGGDYTYGTGNDTYLFQPGDGIDTLRDYDPTAGNLDTVRFGVNPLDLVFTRSGNNLQMSLHGSSDRLTVNGWYASTQYQTETLQSADNQQLLNTQVDQLIQAMAQFSANNGGITWDQAIDQRPNDVQAVLAAYWQPAA